MYGSEAWSVTKTLARRLDAFDSWLIPDMLPTLLSGRPPAVVLSSLPSYSRETAPLLFACGTC